MKRTAFDREQSEADSFGGSLVAARHWKGLRKAGFAAAVETVASVPHWETMLPAMDTTPEDAARFLARFDTPQAREARAKAIAGLLVVRNPREKHVLHTAHKLAAALEAGTVAQRTLDTGKGTLTSYLCECVASGDWKSLETLAKLVKRGDSPEDGRGGELSYHGQAWTSFCQLHFQRVPTLPSKREIRETVDLAEHNRGDFSKWLVSLGLGGLPEE